MPYTYILYSSSIDKYYAGYTRSNLEERLNKHNTNHKGFTGRVNDWKVVWNEYHDLKTEAYKREREIKSWKSRKKVEVLIGSAHPD